MTSDTPDQTPEAPHRHEQNSSFRSCPVVGIGASAGGLEALQTFMAHAPPDGGMAYVVVFHLCPERKSLLPELLGKHTAMPVRFIENGMAVKADEVFVLPPNTEVQIRQRCLYLHPRASSKGSLRTIDLFFRSLATDLGHDAIGVILSGTGEDGTLGIRTIKAAGGHVLIQDEHSARFSGMPHSAIVTGLADAVLPAEALPAKARELVAALQPGNYKEEKNSTDAIVERLPAILRLLQQYSGNDFGSYKPMTMMRRIIRRMAITGLNDVDAYVQRLETRPVEIEALFRDLLISVTHFFRDPEAFAVLGERVLAPLIEKSTAGDGLKIWVVGCSTGKEAYSVAILLFEELERQGRGDITAQIFATDLNERNIAAARAGLYPAAEIVGELSAERLARFFTKTGQSYQVIKKIREMVVFAPHNLTKDPPFSKLNLICCRNLLIYLQSSLQKKVFPLFHYALKAGGHLFLGTSESIGALGELFATVDKKWKIYQRREPSEPVGVRFPLLASQDAPPHFKEHAKMTSHSTILLGSLAEKNLLNRYAPPAVIINNRLELVHFSGRTGKYLEPPVGEPSLNILGMAREELRPVLRATIRKAFKNMAPVVSRNIEISYDGKGETVRMVVEPMAAAPEGDGLVMVIFEPVTLQTTEDLIEAEPQHDWDEECKSYELQIKQLEEELRITNEELQSTIEQLEASNEELKSSNEELMSMNEELQSTNEEIESSREELQALNEELVTVNAELEHKVEELEQANSDIQNLMNSSQIATIILDKQLQVKRYTPAAAELFHLIPTDIGRPFHHLSSKFAALHPEHDAQRVLRTLESFEREVCSVDERCYLMRSLPYRTVHDVIDGVVLTLVDITDRRTMERERETLATIVENSSDAIFGIDAATRIVNWNPGAERLFGYAADEIVGQTISQLFPADRTEDVALILSRTQAGQRIKLMDSRGLCKNDKQVDIGLSLSPIHDHQHSSLSAAVIARDITLRAQAEEALRRAMRAAEEADKAKSEFIANVSHEIRTPMTMILGTIELLLDTRPDDLQRSYLAMANASAEHLLRIIEGILDYAMLESGQFALLHEPFDPRQAISQPFETICTLAEKKGLEFTCEMAPAVPPTLMGDGARVSQVVINLLDNAVKFTEKGQVWVRVDCDRSLTERADQTWLRIEVQDTGIGISAEKQDRIFQRFSQVDGSTTRRFGGVGLGLAICKSLVAAMGGTITFRSEEGRGTVFSVSLPFAPSDQPRANESAGHEQGNEAEFATAVGSSNVLLAEDDPQLLDIISRLLRKRGWNVHTTINGRAALHSLERGNFDLVILDLEMPEMDGYELTRKIRDHEVITGRHLPILALTAHAMKEDRDQCFVAGMDAYLVKPFHVEELTRIMEQLLAT